MTSLPQQLPPICAIVSKDGFLRGETLSRLLEGLGEIFGLARVEGAEAVLAEVLDDARTPSLFGGRQVVVVDRADPFVQAHRAALEQYGEEPSLTGHLILLCNSFPKNTKLYRIINKSGTVICAEPPKGRAVHVWLRRRAEEHYKKELDARAVSRLLEHIGPELGTLDTELSKLVCFVGARSRIGAGDVDELTGYVREEKVFAVTDAIMSGDAPTALHQWQQVLATDRSAPGRALAGLAWGIRRLREARVAWDRGASIHELAHRMYADPSTLERRLRRAPLSVLDAQQQDLLSADVAMKTGFSSLELLVERFIVKHASAAMN